MNTIQSSLDRSQSAAYDSDALSLDRIALSTPEEVCAASILETESDVQDGAREAQRAAQQLRAQESAARVEKLHEAADFAMVAGLVSAGATLAQSAGSAAGGGWADAGKITAAVANGAEAIVKGQADHARADAASHEELANRAGDAARESGEAADAANETADRALQRLAEVTQARRRAEEAATRA